MYKSRPLFVLYVLTTKIKLRMPTQSLNIDLSNAASCRLSCSSEFMKKTYRVRIGGIGSGEGGGGGGGRGRHNHLGPLITPAVLYGYTQSWIPIHQVIGSYVIIVGVCPSNSLATRRGTRNLIYILAFILLNLLTTSAYSASPTF